MPSSKSSNSVVHAGCGGLTLTIKFCGDMFIVQLLSPKKTKPNIGPLNCYWVRSALVFCIASGGRWTKLVLQEPPASSFCITLANEPLPCSRIPETSSFCANDGHSYRWRALDWCPVMSRISLSGTPALKSADAPAARRLWFVFILEISVSWHMASTNFLNFSFRTGAHSY